MADDGITVRHQYNAYIIYIAVFSKCFQLKYQHFLTHSQPNKPNFSFLLASNQLLQSILHYSIWTVSTAMLNRTHDMLQHTTNQHNRNQ